MGCSCSKTPSNIASFRKKALKEMNGYRKMHGSPPLKMTNKMNKYAQQWAEQLAKKGNLSHRSDCDYGENLAMGTANIWMNAVKMWYDEASRYDYKNEGFRMGTGHFSQIVWKSSKMVGIGVATSKSGGMTFVVANFDPPGNVQGKYRQNVFPPKR